MKVNGMNIIEYADFLMRSGWSEEMACMEANYIFENARKAVAA